MSVLLSCFTQHILSYILGYIFYLGLIFDGYNEYKDVSDYKLEVVTDLPNFATWDGVESHEGGDILRIQVR